MCSVYILAVYPINILLPEHLGNFGKGSRSACREIRNVILLAEGKRDAMNIIFYNADT
jgi:hypothetical protein